MPDKALQLCQSIAARDEHASWASNLAGRLLLKTRQYAEVLPHTVIEAFLPSFFLRLKTCELTPGASKCIKLQERGNDPV